MKKACLLSISIICFMIGARAQYPYLHQFNGTNGSAPWGGLVLFKGILYGVTTEGGLYNHGVIFSVDTNGNNFKVLLNFKDTNGTGANGSLVLSGNKLYGTTSSGGAYGNGVVFSIDTGGNGYKDMHDFDTIDGSLPRCGLVIGGGTLYGTTVTGGVNNDGVIFSIDTNGAKFKKLLDFNMTNGTWPDGILTLSGGKLYGASSDGGSQGWGNIYSIDTNGTGFKEIYAFTKTGNYPVFYPSCSVLLSGGTIYGVAYDGGVNNNGVIYSVDTSGSGFTDLYDSPNSGTGSINLGNTLAISGNKIYGIGASGLGNIFTINISGGGYNELFDFGSNYGYSFNAPGALTLSGNKIYGVVEGDPPATNGFVYCYKPLQISSIAGNSAVCYNNLGSASVNVTGGNDYYNRYTYKWSPGGDSTNPANGLSPGTYTVVVTDKSNNSVTSYVTIPNPPTQIKTSTATGLSSCSNNSGTATVNVSGGAFPYKYNWSPGGNTNSSINGLIAGYYTCTVTDSLGCTSTTSVNVRDSGTVKALIVSSTNLNCFSDHSGQATATVSGGTKPFTYSWSPSGGSNALAQNISAGTYTCTVTDSNGCKADTLVTITQPDSLVTNIWYFPDTNTCSGSIGLTVSGGTGPYSYSWSTGQTTDSIYNLCHGLVECYTVTDKHGCIDTACWTIYLDTTMGVKQINQLENNVKVYPNPSNGVFNFQLQGVNHESKTIEVYNMLGEKVFSQYSILTTQYSLDLSNQPSGVYPYRIIAKDGSMVSTGKLIKQ